MCILASSLEQISDLMFIGAGESGKSTILKQMKLIHASGFSNSDRHDYRAIIFANLLTSVKAILEAMDGYGIEFEDKENEVPWACS